MIHNSMVESMVENATQCGRKNSTEYGGECDPNNSMVEGMVELICSIDMGPRGGGYQCMALSPPTSNIIEII